jgi:hypothetical protein
MPRHDLQQSKPLDAATVEAIVAAIRPFDAEDCIRAAFARYPGPSEAWDHISPSLPPAKNVRNCIIEVNKEVMLRPFLSRMIEDQWANGVFREALLNRIPDLVLAPVGLQAALAGVAKGVARLLGLIAVDPKVGCVGGPGNPKDERAFAMVSEKRAAFVRLRESLGQLQALKELHDALHVLAIRGADWLDPALDDDEDDLALPLAALAAKVAEAGAIIGATRPGLKAEHAALGQRAAEALAAAFGELTGADESAQAAGVQRLRQTLMFLPKDIDAAMFGLSRDLPVRAICLAFADLHDPDRPDYAEFDQAQRAMANLGEALRGRVLEHAMWQATDVNIHAIETILGAHDASFLRLFNERWQEIRRSIRYLSDAAFQDGGAPDLFVRMALDAYDNALQPRAGGPAVLSLDEAFGEIVKTFSAFKSYPRERFLAVDTALKTELALIGALKADLDELIDRRVGELSSNLLDNP